MVNGQQTTPMELLFFAPDVWTIIAGVVALAGLVLSVIALIQQKPRLRVELNTAYYLGGSADTFVCDFTFLNCSPLPISISGLVLTAEGEKGAFPCSERKLLKTLTTRSRGVEVSKQIYTKGLPIGLTSYSAARVSIAFDGQEFKPAGRDYDSNTVKNWKLKTLTTRKSFEFTLVPPTCEALWTGEIKQQFSDFVDE